MIDQRIAHQVYPVRSMDQAALEQAVLLPAKFVELIKTAGDTLLDPIITCRLSNRLSPNDQSLYGVLGEGRPTTAVPALGGRYIIVKAYHRLRNPTEGRLETAIWTLWDIGISQAQPKVLTRMAIQENNGMAQCEAEGLVFDPRPDHQGQLYLLLSYRKEERCVAVLMDCPLHSFHH